MMASSSHSSGSGNVMGEFSVRIPKKSNKKYGVMQFNRQTKIDFKKCGQVKMERENNLKEFKATVGDEMPVFGAGSEFGRERREEARRKKYGVRTQKYKEEDQPWILKVGGKQGKKFKGRKEGLVAENSCYYIFKQLPDSSFEAHPVDSFYNFAPMIQYRTLNAEEAEEEFGRRDRTMNFFTVMLQRKLKDTSEEGNQEDKPKKNAKSEQLTITEDDEFQNMLLSEDEGSDDDEDGGKSSKKKGKKTAKKGGKNKKKKKQQVDDEAEEESDEGDFDARELDYISEESSEGEAEIEEKHDIKGIDQELQKIEDDEQEDEENEAEEGREDEANKEEGEIGNDKKGDDSDSSQSDSSDSDIDDNKIQSALLMQKKPGKKSSNKSSSKSSTGPSSRSNTPTANMDTTKTLSDAATKLQKESDLSSKVKKVENLSGRSIDKAESRKIKSENGETKFQAIKRPASSSSGEHLSPKKMRTESPVPQTGTPPSEQGITEDVVRRYLMRKPMQTKDLLYKLKSKKVGLSKDKVVQRLAEVLKRLNPEQIKIKDKTYWTIKSSHQKAAGI